MTRGAVTLTCHFFLHPCCFSSGCVKIGVSGKYGIAKGEDGKKRPNSRKDGRHVVLFLGLDGAGKSTLISSIISKRNVADIIAPRPTVGFARPKETRLPSGTVLVLHELGGSSGFRKAWKARIESSDGIAYVIDASENGKARFSEAFQEFTNLGLESYGKPVVMVVTKMCPADKNSMEQARNIFLMDSKYVYSFDHLTEALETLESEIVSVKTKPQLIQNKVIGSKAKVYPEEFCASLIPSDSIETKVANVRSDEHSETKRVVQKPVVSCSNIINGNICGQEAILRNASTKWRPFCQQCIDLGLAPQ